MTENLEKTFELATDLVALSNQKRILFEQYEQSLLYFYNGGTFQIDKNLISFLNVLKSYENQSCVLVDLNNLPIEVEDISIFLQNVLDQYQQASNLYLAEYQKIKNKRNLTI